ncbi:hypothetical protein [Paenimyroides baculatum]|uniref:Uncharacterized protein n=1 Tax=Paenimyroides baculatum TaxID=2608000 RepID=A0A5M6CRT1_9FLAO|nr:hypothetical protein [Paenimyroides baculatum]KAA5535815.1 hypothetical protein F0460_05090 [Paenimyroides baculatum]
MNGFLIIGTFLLVSFLIPVFISYLILKKSAAYKYFTIVFFLSVLSSFIGLLFGGIFNLGYFKFKGEIYDIETLFIIYYYQLSLPFLIVFLLSLLYWILKITNKKSD